jgi:hypothetical protein
LLVKIKWKQYLIKTKHGLLEQVSKMMWNREGLLKLQKNVITQRNSKKLQGVSTIY